tara:strand:+ start:1560 stop:1778 length:219 start_codon:yes stop_codon:yes gene_type:complete
MRKRLNEWSVSKVLHAIALFGFAIAIMFSILSCQDIYIGKTEAELVQEMFRVDSLINHISFMIDSIETVNND